MQVRTTPIIWGETLCASAVSSAGSPSIGTALMQQAEKDCVVVVWPLGSDSQQAGTFDGDTCWNLPGFLRSDDYGNGVATSPSCCFDPRAPNDPPPRDPDDPLILTMIIDSVVESISELAADGG